MFRRVLGAMLLLTAVGCAEPEELTANNFFRRERPSGVTAGTGGSAGAGTPTSSTAAGAGTSSSTAASSTAASSTAATSTATSSTAGTGGAAGSTSAAGGSAGAGTQVAGTGGASGSGGASGAGGSGAGGAVADAAVDRITPPTMGISLLYKAAGAGAMADSIQAEITINNAGPDTIPMSEFTVQYFFTDEVTAARMPLVNINYGNRNGPSGYLNIEGMITKRIAPAPNPVATANTMVELGFAAGAGSLAKNDNAVFLMKYNGAMYPMLTQSNDYSFDGSKSTPTLWDKIVILRGGNVIWGTPP